MAQNCLYVGSALIGVELSRAYVVAVVAKRSVFLALVSASLLFTVIAIPMAKFTTVGGLEDGAELAGGTVLPTASENLLASFLALVGGPVAAIAYRGALEAFEWFSPILPDLTWMTTALVGTLAPAAGLLIVRGLSAPEAGEEDEAEAGPAPSLAPWMIAAFAAVALLWFNTGMLGVNPHVISGHSMQPEFDLGDMVITRDVSPASIEEGDVIWFRQDGINVIHRVMEVRSERGETLFITQGDNNNAPDHQPVAANQVEGKVILVVPKIGWLSIGVRNLIGYVGNVPLPINRASEEPGQAQQEPAAAPVGDSAGSQAAEDAQSAAHEEPFNDSAGSQAAEDAQSAAHEEPTSPLPMPTIEYEVQPGDSLIDIAAGFGTTVEALTQLNGLEEPNAILYGLTLSVPYVGDEPGDVTAGVSP
jgi:signal peptidase